MYFLKEGCIVFFLYRWHSILKVQLTIDDYQEFKWWPHLLLNWTLYSCWLFNQFWLTLQWRHNEHDGGSNHPRLDCLCNRLFRRRSKKTSKLRVTGLCEGNSQVTGEFPAQRASNAEYVSIWWCHHGLVSLLHGRGDYHIKIMNLTCIIVTRTQTRLLWETGNFLGATRFPVRSC